MSRNKNARSDAGGIFSLADELLENVLLRAIDVHSRIGAHRLSATCRRFRRILLPRIYRQVTISPHTRGWSSQVDSFLVLVPAYGHLCHTLVFHIINEHPSSFPERFSDCLQYFTALQVLDVGVADRHSHSAVDVRPWKKLCSALPKVSELHLRGFTWGDAMGGLAHSDMSSVQTLSLELDADELTLEMAAAFHRAFTGIVDVSLSAYWHITPDWIRSAFTGRQLTHLAITGVDWATKFLKQQQLDDWAASISLLVQLNAPSLTSLAINSALGILVLLQIAADLPRLTTLALNGFDFGEPDRFEAVMQSFAKCPLQSLRLGCRGVPDTFHTWFDTGSELWPDLQTLSLEVETIAGPGDKEWDEANPEDRDIWEETDFDTWTSHSRLALESLCSNRGISVMICRR